MGSAALQGMDGLARSPEQAIVARRLNLIKLIKGLSHHAIAPLPCDDGLTGHIGMARSDHLCQPRALDRTPANPDTSETACGRGRTAAKAHSGTTWSSSLGPCRIPLNRQSNNLFCALSRCRDRDTSACAPSPEPGDACGRPASERRARVSEPLTTQRPESPWRWQQPSRPIFYEFAWNPPSKSMNDLVDTTIDASPG